jgi:hypothetical protein
MKKPEDYNAIVVRGLPLSNDGKPVASQAPTVSPMLFCCVESN